MADRIVLGVARGIHAVGGDRRHGTPVHGWVFVIGMPEEARVDHHHALTLAAQPLGVHRLHAEQSRQIARGVQVVVAHLGRVGRGLPVGVGDREDQAAKARTVQGRRLLAVHAQVAAPGRRALHAVQAAGHRLLLERRFGEGLDRRAGGLDHDRAAGGLHQRLQPRGPQGLLGLGPIAVVFEFEQRGEGGFGTRLGRGAAAGGLFLGFLLGHGPVSPRIPTSNRTSVPPGRGRWHGKRRPRADGTTGPRFLLLQRSRHPAPEPPKKGRGPAGSYFRRSRRTMPSARSCSATSWAKDLARSRAVAPLGPELRAVAYQATWPVAVS